MKGLLLNIGVLVTFTSSKPTTTKPTTLATPAAKAAWQDAWQGCDEPVGTYMRSCMTKLDFVASKNKQLR